MKQVKVRFQYGLIFLLTLTIISFGKMMYTKYITNNNVMPAYKIQK